MSGEKSQQESQKRWFLILIASALAASMVYGFPKSLSALSLWTSKCLTLDEETLRAELLPSYGKQRQCLESASRTIAESEAVIFSTDGIPPWFAPYYLAPRRFFYDQESIREGFRRRSTEYRTLKIAWKNGQSICQISEREKH